MKNDVLTPPVTFLGEVIRCTYNTPEYKIYAMKVDKQIYPEVKRNKYGGVTIMGELFDLSDNVSYEVTGIEQESKYGYGYRVSEIKRSIPSSITDILTFLSEILTMNQATTLFNHYPNIIDLVREGRTNEVDLSKLKGIKDKTFKRIVDKITENFCLIDLITEFKGFLSLNVIRKLYTEYETIARLKSKLQQNPYKCLCSIAGIGFIKADRILLDMEKASKDCVKKGEPPIVPFLHDLKTSPERCLACIHHLLMENQDNGNTKMNLADLRAQCIKTVPDCAHHFTEAVKDQSIYYDVETMDVAMRYIYSEEKYIADKILNNLNSGSIWDCDPEKYRNVDGAVLSDEQIQVVQNVCKYPISILNGAAGCGKSFSMKAVINMLDDLHKSFTLLAPTGKASKVLASFTNRPASTIHRGLAYNVETGWGLNKNNPFSDDVIIVDEFSMVDVSLFRHLIEAIDFSKTKLLMIGDNAQLPSVSCGNLFHDFMMSGIIPMITLTKVFRYSEGGLMRIATDVRNCRKYLDSSMKSNITVFGDNKDYAFIDTKSESIPNTAVSLYKQLLDDGNSIENIQILTAKNVGDCGTVVLNNMIQKVANQNCGKSPSFTCGDTTYYVGDIVIQKANNYKAPLSRDYMQYDEELESYVYSMDEYCDPEELPTAFIANGESGIVQQVSSSYMVIKFDDIYVEYTKSEARDIGLGYAISIHKSQGSSIDNVIICSPESHVFMMNSNLLYVGLTRMRKKCFHIGSLNSVNMAVRKKANLTRHTFMQQFLTGKVVPTFTSEDDQSLPWYSDEELKNLPDFYGNV